MTRALLSSAVLPDATPAVLRALAASASHPSWLVVHEGLPDRDTLIRRLQGHAIVLNSESQFDDEILAACPQIKVIVFLGTGAESYVDLASCARRGVKVRTIAGYGDRTVAEHAIALMFAVFRDLGDQHHAMRTGDWRGAPLGEVRGKTLGIMGLGGVGREMAQLGAALGMKVLAWSPTARPDPLCPIVDLDTLLDRADVLSLHLRLTPQMVHILDADRLGRMKHGAVLINTARAGLVDTPKMVEMLRSGQLRGAGLDVFDEEPAPPDTMLRSAPNVVLSCHTAWQGTESANRLVAMGLDLVAEELAALH